MRFNPVNDDMKPLNCQLYDPKITIIIVKKEKKKYYYREFLTLGIITGEGKKTIFPLGCQLLLLSCEDVAQGSEAVHWITRE